jgi:hypothetical protein
LYEVREQSNNNEIKWSIYLFSPAFISRQSQRISKPHTSESDRIRDKKSITSDFGISIDSIINDNNKEFDPNANVMTS